MQFSRSRRRLRSNVRQMLGGLGDDAAAVARHLGEAGVQGTPRDVRDCAIAVYLRAVIGADPDVRSLDVMADGVVITPPKRWSPSISVGLSPAVRTFVVGFDRHDYPTLVRADPRAAARAGARAGADGTPGEHAAVAAPPSDPGDRQLS